MGHISYSLGRHKIKFLLEQTKDIYKHLSSQLSESYIDKFSGYSHCEDKNNYIYKNGQDFLSAMQ
jgi:hypothetical protein